MCCRLLVCSLVLLAGCAATQQPTAKVAGLRQGDASAPPSLAALPEIGAGGNERMHRGLTLARQVFEARLPSPPRERSFDALSAWVETDVAQWIAARRESVEDTRFQFDSTGEAAVDVRVISRAVIGLLQEDTAQALSSIPAPIELDSEPEIAAMYRDLVRVQSDPFLGAARSEYRACAESALEDGQVLRRFAEFCRARFDRIDEAEARQAQQSLAAAR